ISAPNAPSTPYTYPLSLHDALPIFPRGGEEFVRWVAERSRIPVLKHDKGLVHVFVDASADPAMAAQIVVNAKAQRPGVCNALERSEEHTSELQSRGHLVCRLLLEKK